MVKLEQILIAITYLFAATAWATVAGSLNVLYSVIFAAMGVISLYLDFRPCRRIPGWLLAVASVLMLVHSLLRINTEYFIEPILDTLVILMGIKLLSEKKQRDYMQIYMLGIFLLLGSGLISLSMIFLLHLFILLAFSTMALIVLAFLSQDPQMAIGRKQATSLFQHAAIICCIAIPASAFFFVILPRTYYPLFSFLGKGWAGVSGFSDKVDLGDLSEIQEDGSTIFRVQMDKVNDADLYWRGIVLDRFDGASWKASSQPSRLKSVPLNGHQVHQTVYLEPYGHKYLFALDKPLSISLANTDRSSVLTFSTHAHVFNRLQYSAVSVITAVLPEDSIDLDKYLHLPEGWSPRIRGLVTQVSGTAGSDDETVSALLKFISRGDFKYSMKNLPVSGTPLEEFLFVTQEGNCEYFASALGVMLRMAGIPSRLVGGYKGGYYNAAGGYYLVLQRNAHVWVEAYTNGHGWTRLDPTPYTIENPGAAYAESYFLQLKLVVDTFNYYWNRFVITYDFGRQLHVINVFRSSLAKANFKIALHKVEFRKILVISALLLGGMLLVAGTRVKRRAEHERILNQFLRRMSNLGYHKATWQGLEEFVNEIREEDLKLRAAIFVTEYQNIFYTDKPFTTSDTMSLRKRIRDL